MTPCAFHLLPDPLQGIYGHPRNPQFPVQMGASTQARAADLAKKLSTANSLTWLDIQSGQVPVAGEHPIAMIKHNRIASYEQRLSEHHPSGGRRIDRRSRRCTVILARVCGNRRIVPVGATRAIWGGVAELAA